MAFCICVTLVAIVAPMELHPGMFHENEGFTTE